MNVRPAIDVSDLPNEVFGQENITWWAAIIGEAIEGFVLVLAVFSYLYLAHDSPAWPPLHTPLPSLGIPTLNLGMMVLSVPAAWYAARAANREDRRGTLIGLVLHSIIGIVICVLRYYEMLALNVRWDTNAYGSVTWAILFTHGYMAFFDVMNTLGLALLFVRLEPVKKHYVDVAEGSFFWYFVLATWVPLYLLVFFGPRWT